MVVGIRTGLGTRHFFAALVSAAAHKRQAAKRSQSHQRHELPPSHPAVNIGVPVGANQTCTAKRDGGAHGLENTPWVGCWHKIDDFPAAAIPTAF